MKRKLGRDFDINWNGLNLIIRSVLTCSIVICFVVQAAAIQESNPTDKSVNDSADEKIRLILETQAKCWNRKDLEGFMGVYWKSEKLTFSGGGKTTRGWQATLDRYRKKYPPEKMGRLTFNDLEVNQLSASIALVLGKWHLQFAKDKAGGNFSLVLKKMSGEWKIIHDHSSTLEE